MTKASIREVGDGFKQVVRKLSKKREADVNAVVNSMSLLKIVDTSKEMVEEVQENEGPTTAEGSTCDTARVTEAPKLSYPDFEPAVALPPQPRALGPKIVTLRRINVPRNRLKPLESNWKKLIEPLVIHMKLQVRFNIKRKCIEMRPSPNQAADKAALDKACEYVKAFLLGFELHDAIALLRLDNIFLQSFKVTEVKRLVNENLGRAIGRIAGKEGKTKFAIENSTRTRIVIADKTIHLMGSHENIILARDSICSLIIGSPPSKVYNHLRVVSRRMKERA
eukprot:Blabericola_migrator_1__2430@NODE_1685_length_4002_cov_97_585260_g1092_i0_p3_GENE_NODE_1685_length_4002_cov_97_585260_g1092_i0NODE_1685_length_4002_cov_97_585260_g1092_i0_p3_ORF_typecomplete_len280_score47_46KH_8/PF17903_1/2_2e12KH_8/PF17903_1/7_4e03KH_1/PF00013_29/2_9e05_NODE_1685_length_4002_cov_97_585260_g1092_i031223961